MSVDVSSHALGESSCASHKSPSQSLSQLEDHGSFSTPTSSSTPNILGTQLHHYSISTDSQQSITPLDMGLYSSFSYYGPPGFSRGGNTPVPSVAGSHHVSSSMWQPTGLTFPHLWLTNEALNAEQKSSTWQQSVKC